jgi:hypothetical protein
MKNRKIHLHKIIDRPVLPAPDITPPDDLFLLISMNNKPTTTAMIINTPKSSIANLH